MKIYALVICCLLMVSNVLGQSTRKWTTKHTNVLYDLSSDTTDIRGIHFSVNESSPYHIEDVFKEFFSGIIKKDIYFFEIRSSEVPPAFMNRTLDIFEIIELYLITKKI
jgi:hypothetical protein